MLYSIRVSRTDLTRLDEEQLRLAKRVVLEDDFDSLGTVAGADIAYTGNKIICAIVVMDIKTLKVRDSKSCIGVAKFPYIPSYLSYREAPITIETYHKLELEPDILIFDGNSLYNLLFVRLH